MSITAGHVRSAFAYIRDHGIEPNHESTKWDIVDPDTQQRFPPKAVLRVSHELAGERPPAVGGGWPTNDPLRALGFRIVLKSDHDKSEESADIDEVFKITQDETTRRRLIDARLGQGAFRKELLDVWRDQCAMTGCRIEAVLRASHIKPWRESNNDERLDSFNGIILAASIDALFDRFLMTFSDDGRVLVSSELTAADLVSIGVPAARKISFYAKTKIYLAHHRTEFGARCNGRSFPW